MPGFSVPPLAVVNQIKSNLQDRYDSGYSILKELLQNADDAGSRRFRLDARSGWPTARNPLLRGSGLLVVNDGAFSADDRRGILSFGESVKADDRTAIGKFGLGQKSVFHLCDAFVVHAVGVDEPFSRVVNPFLDVDVAGNVTGEWEHISDGDVALLRAPEEDFRERALILWLPFRRDGLIPAPDAGFSTIRPDPETIVSGFACKDDLQVLLTALRHLEWIEIRRERETLCSVRVEGVQERLRGPDDHPCTRLFRGTIDTGSDDSARFVGREATIQDSALERLRCSNYWPKTISALSAESGREKGEQHGAVTLLRTSNDETQRSELRISWAVFLPISETEDQMLPIDMVDFGPIHLLLHGYFFLDSGRRHIEGLAGSEHHDEPADEAGLRRAWNTRLRDTAVLPLVPALLKDAFDQGMMTAKEFAQLIATVAKSHWFQANRTAICRENALVRVLEGPEVPRSRRVAWHLVPTGVELRSLPATLADSPERVNKLFDDIDQWAQDRNTTLCIDGSASLTAQPMRWTLTELDSLFAVLSPRAFHSEPLAALVKDLLSKADLNDDDRTVLAPHLVRAFRQAMLETTPLAPSSYLSHILGYVPRDLVFALPRSVELRGVLRALASSNAGILPVRYELLDAGGQSPPSEPDLNVLLRALAPLIDGEAGAVADQASTAALALLTGHDISTLVSRRRFQDIKILRARDPITESVIVLSFAELFVLSRQGFLFRRTPNVESLLRTMVGALPDVQPLIVDAAIDRHEENNGVHDLTRIANKQTLFVLINRASTFGGAAERARMINVLSFLEGDDEPEALRKLCAGEQNPDAPDATLWTASKLPTELERIIDVILEQRVHEFLVPSSVVAELTGKKRQELRIRDLDTPGLEELIEDSIHTFQAVRPTESERKTLLKTELADNLLRRLPIHDRSDGSVGSAEGLFWEDSEWPIPDRFGRFVSTIKLSDDPGIRSRQKRIVRAWSPGAQIEAALAQTEAHRYQEEILHAISQSCRDSTHLPSALREVLRTERWLGTADIAVAPKDVLQLPRSVDEAAEAHFRDSAGYISLGRLPERIRRHPGFRYAERHVIPDQRSSVGALARMIDAAGLAGRLGAAEEYPIEQFTELAKMGADLKLPGWPLLAAVLSSIDGDPDGVREVADSFHEVSETEPGKAGRHLEALAAVVDRDAGHREAAEEAFRHGFGAVAKWAEDARRRAFSKTRVPTMSGGWRSGREVLAEDNGVAPAHVLADAYAAMIPGRKETVDDRDVDEARSADEEELDIEVLRTSSVTQHREFLKGWSGSVPPELVAVYLGIAGRHNQSMDCYRGEWARDTTINIDHELETLEHDRRMPALVLIREVRGSSVEAIALSGDRFHAPLSDHASSSLVIGNLHKRKRFLSPFGPEAHRRTRIITFHVRTPNQELSVSDRVQLFREFVETAAAECLSDDSMDEVRQIVDRAAEVGQATLEDTERLLRDRLPTLLAALKLPPRSRALHALRRYEAVEIRAAEEAKVVYRNELWQSIGDRSAATEVLAAVRARITDQGYSASRVLFELFQNAEDAYAQRDPESEGACFRVDFGVPSDRGLRIVHWGRPINHRGSNAEEGRRRGYDRDLLNMLVMNFSEKRSEEGVTGKFGLGFKCVHLLSDSVGIASGFVAVRTVGGILPIQWPDGLRETEKLSHPNGRKATVIDVPYTTEKMAADGRRTEQAFRQAMTWLPAFARSISRIEVRGSTQGTVDSSVSTLSGNGSIEVVAIRDIRRQLQRALRLGLGNGYRLLLKVRGDGPECFEPSVGRVWNLAPLEENVRSGWLLNGPFPVDPGRGRLAGSIEDRRKGFAVLGRALGERLLDLHDLVERHWETLAVALDLRVADSQARRQFWSRLFDVMTRDLDDDLARCLHAVNLGYGRLAAERPVVPTRLPRPFDGLVRASSINSFADKALAGIGILEATRSWCSADRLRNRLVASEVATLLKKVGFSHMQPITLSELLRIEMGEDKRIDVNLGTRLGQVITQDGVEKEPLLEERREILTVASQATFRAQDGAWRSVRGLSSRGRGDDDEALLCEFAPDDALLHEDYRAEALKFFEVARRQSGYGPGVPLLREWVDAANDEHRRRAVLRYLVRGRQGPALAKLVRDYPPTWMAEVQARYTTHSLLDDWADEDRMKLVVELEPSRLKVGPSTSRPQTSDVSKVLMKVHEWWMAEGGCERRRYASRVYPEGFNPSCLSHAADRAAWFTMFALACYQLFGRTQDEPHRSFIEVGWRDGWWAELAESEPPTDVQPWLDRLERWSAPDRVDQTYHQWQRTLVDLYTIARGLHVYVELILKLPRVVEEHGRVSLDDILRPSYSPLLQRLGLDAAPIDRSLGIGANWLIRELSRNGVYDSSEARMMAPYCWAPSQRVRKFLTTLDPRLDLTADMADQDASPTIHDFVIEHVGAERALFDGDFDLPLQVITRKRHRGRLNGWFEGAGLEAPEFRSESEENEDYA